MIKNDKSKINSCVYIAFHKECTLPTVDGYQPLLVGAKGKVIYTPRSYDADDTGINISDKNDAYCELTGLYWIWKNCSYDYVGLVHYRRFFAQIYGVRINTRNFTFGGPSKGYRIYSGNELNKLLYEHDVIVKTSERYDIGNGEIFRVHQHVGVSNWNRLKELIRTKYPEYYEAFCEYEREKYLYNCNMFYTKKTLLDKYCSFLFPILDEMDKIQIAESGERYHDREEGYFAEFLVGVWLKKNNLRVRVLPAVNTAQNIDIEDCVYNLAYLPIYYGKKAVPQGLKQSIKEHVKKDTNNEGIQNTTRSNKH